MKTRPVRITARQWVYLAKTVDMPEQDYETYLSICENCRDFNEQDGCLGDIAARYRINAYYHACRSPNNIDRDQLITFNQIA